MPTIENLIRLSAGRWLIPLLALADAGPGFRFAEAVRRLGIARGVARTSVDALVAAGWLGPNPGHGHPLRPEYLATAGGMPVAAWSARAMIVRAELELAPEMLTRWTLPVIAVLAGGEARFSDLAMALVPISPRALSLTLKGGIGTGLVGRRLEDSFPPTPLYRLDRRGRRLAQGMGLAV